MKNTHDRKTVDLIAPQRGRPAVYASAEARDKAAREHAAARQAALRERRKELQFDLSGLLRIQAVMLEHAPEEARILEKLEAMIEQQRRAKK